MTVCCRPAIAAAAEACRAGDRASLGPGAVNGVDEARSSSRPAPRPRARRSPRRPRPRRRRASGPRRPRRSPPRRCSASASARAARSTRSAAAATSASAACWSASVTASSAGRRGAGCSGLPHTWHGVAVGEPPASSAAIPASRRASSSCRCSRAVSGLVAGLAVRVGQRGHVGLGAATSSARGRPGGGRAVSRRERRRRRGRAAPGRPPPAAVGRRSASSAGISSARPARGELARPRRRRARPRRPGPARRGAPGRLAGQQRSQPGEPGPGRPAPGGQRSGVEPVAASTGQPAARHRGQRAQRALAVPLGAGRGRSAWSSSASSGRAGRGTLGGVQGRPRRGGLGPRRGSRAASSARAAATRRGPLPAALRLGVPVGGARPRRRPRPRRAGRRGRRARRGRRPAGPAAQPHHPAVGGRLREAVAGQLVGRRHAGPVGHAVEQPLDVGLVAGRTRTLRSRLWSCTQSSMRANRSVRNRCCSTSCRSWEEARRNVWNSPWGAAPPARTGRRSCPSGRRPAVADLGGPGGQEVVGAAGGLDDRRGRLLGEQPVAALLGPRPLRRPAYDEPAVARR